MKKTHTLLIAAVLSLSSSMAFAAKSADMPTGPVECDGLRVATGPAGKGYSKLFSDLQKVCGDTVKMCEVVTTGGLDNVTAMSTKNAEVGFAQADTWQFMKGGDENIAALQAIAGLNFNYLHVVVAANGYRIAGEKKYGFMKGDDKVVVINRFSDLRGKRVVLVGSAALMGQQLEKMLAYGMTFEEAPDDAAAFDKVRTGQAAAAFTVSGWPSGTVSTLPQKAGLTLVPFDATLPSNNSTYVVRSLNYKNLGVYNNNSLAVPNIFFTRPFKGERAQDVAKLRSCLTEKLEDLQEGAYQPAWNEVKSFDKTGDVPRFNPPTQKVGKK